MNIDAKRVPLVRRDLHSRPLPFGAAAVDGVINGDIVLERVRAGNGGAVDVLHCTSANVATNRAGPTRQSRFRQ